jgi:hypothetical protein
MALTPLFAASRNECKGINWNELTVADIQAQSKDGNTVLHYAAYYGCFEKIPKHLRNKKYWTTTHNGTTVLMSAFERGQISWVNPKDLTEEEILKKNGNGDSILTHAVFSNKLSIIPKSSLTKKILMGTLYSGEPTIHGIIRTKQVGEVPREWLTEEVLYQKDKNGDTAYHKLAHQYLERAVIQKPMAEEIWNQRSLTIRSYDGTTPLHILASENANLIPKDCLTPENLELKDGKNQSVWHYWARGTSWRNLPTELLREEDLLQEDDENGRTPLWYLCTKFIDFPDFNSSKTADADKKFISKVFSQLSERGLEIAKSYKITLIRKLVLKELVKRKINKITHQTQDYIKI